MFAKLLLITVTFGVLGLALLVNRQQRIETTHDMTVIHRRMNEHERSIWRMRAEIARRTTPRLLQEAVRDLPETLVRSIDAAVVETEAGVRRLAETGDAPPPDWGG